MSYVVLFDPALADNEGNRSTNLGDCIISNSVENTLKKIIPPNTELIKFSTHVHLSKREHRIAENSILTFVGGSNLLSSNILQYNQWRLIENPNIFKYLFTSKKDFILFGTGWWQYQNDMTKVTKIFYKKILSKSWIHSTRDDYALEKLKIINGISCLNTSCPTTWSLDGYQNQRTDLNIDTVIFTLTDYNIDIKSDSVLLNILLKYYNKLIFFPQGRNDFEYLRSLEIFQKNKKRFHILEHNIDIYLNILETNSGSVDFIGTRLHGGIKCMDYKIQSLVIAIDNRALEMGKNINLPIAPRNNHSDIINWIQGKKSSGIVILPKENIKKWTKQFY